MPALALLFHVDLRYAIGASLVSVIATSSGAAVSYVREGFSNVRIGMFLEVATTVGAMVGAYLTARISNHAIGIIFGFTLLYSAWSSFHHKQNETPHKQNALAEKLKLSGDYPTDERPRGLRRAECSGRLWHHVYRRNSLRSSRHRLRGGQGSGHGSRHETALQSLHHNQQLHDRCDGCSERGYLSWARLCRPRSGGAGDAGRAGWFACQGRACWSGSVYQSSGWSSR